MSLYDDASLIVYPSGYKASKIYAQKPVSGAGDLTFARASTGTRVNEQGLIETPSVISTTELVTNGDFATDITGWLQYQSVSTWDSGTIKTTVNSVNAYIRTNTVALTGGIQYKVTFKAKASNVSQNIIIYNGATFFDTGLTFDVANTYQEFTYYLDNIASANLIVGQQSLSIGDSMNFDNVSVKEVITSNIPRIDYTGGGCGKLLLEGQRTNTVLSNSDYTASWSLVNVIPTANATTSPNGNNDAQKLTSANTFGQHYIREILGGHTVGAPHVFSCFAKASELDILSLRLVNGGGPTYVNFDLTNGTHDGGANGKMIGFGNGWYRCISYHASSTNATLYPYIYTQVGNTQGDGVSGFYVYGAQLEEGSYETSLINTSGTTVTRLADESSTTGLSSVIGQTEGTLHIKFDRQNSFRGDIALYTDINNRVQIYANSNVTRATVISGGVSIFDVQISSAYGALSVALAYKLNDFKIYVNGSSVYTNTSGAVPTSLNDFYFASNSSGANSFYQRVNALSLFKTRLTDTELATLTTL